MTINEPAGLKLQYKQYYHSRNQFFLLLQQTRLPDKFT